MSGIPIGLIVEGAVAFLLMLTIGYCIVLNQRLKRLHADRDALKQMVTDLVRATELANTAIGDLKATAQEADLTMGTRMEEAERFAVQLANHVTAGQSVLDRIAKITEAARQNSSLKPEPASNRAAAALERLRAHQSMKDKAA
jgi:hypothetical protein